MAFKKVMVVGAGTMGHGIAQVCAQAGLDAVLIDVDRSFVDRAIERIRSGLEKARREGKDDERRGQGYHVPYQRRYGDRGGHVQRCGFCDRSGC